jgi:flavin reductase (DIM6/NTAB) family NADH-FMN oxidoreductase RutF
MADEISEAIFRDALARFASGVTVVVTQQGTDPPIGLTATAFSAVSLAPPLVLVCVARRTRAHDAVVDADHFGISVLAESQKWIAAQCAGPFGERFVGIPLSRGIAQAVLVDGAVAQLECHRYAAHPAGDHTILVGRTLRIMVGSEPPLVHFARTFGTFFPSTDVGRPRDSLVVSRMPADIEALEESP